jgi:hypothetical protein
MALDYTPSVEDVATYLRARTRGPDGNEIGTFTDATVPTDQQVTGAIDAAEPFVTGGLGTVQAGCANGARALWAIKAAEMVEISYFPEQLAPGGTVDRLRALYADLLPAVRACISGDGVGGGGDDGDATAPAFLFEDCCDLALLTWPGIYEIHVRTIVP